MFTKNALLYLSKQEGLKSVLTRISLFNRVTSRFVAGETIEKAAEAVRELNNHKITASFDHLGEAIKSAAEADEEVVEYSKILTLINKEGLDSNVSLKPTQLGLAIDPELFYKNTKMIVEKAKAFNNF